jgi:Integrase core domain
MPATLHARLMLCSSSAKASIEMRAWISFSRVLIVLSSGNWLIANHQLTTGQDAEHPQLFRLTVRSSSTTFTLESRRPPPGLLHHSDRGVQYASRRYRERLAEAGLRGSMSRTGNPYDNARVESFMKTLKHEEVYLHDYATVQDAIDRLPYFLEEVYNRKRLHSSLGYRPPEEYEAQHAQTAA